MPAFTDTPIATTVTVDVDVLCGGVPLRRRYRWPSVPRRGEVFYPRGLEAFTDELPRIEEVVWRDDATVLLVIPELLVRPQGDGREALAYLIESGWDRTDGVHT